MSLLKFHTSGKFKLVLVVSISLNIFFFITIAASNEIQKVQELTAKGMELAEGWRGETSKLDQAEQLFIQALKINPSSAEALTGLGKVEMSRGYISGDRYEESSLKAALQYINKALSSDPRYVKAHFLRGSILSAMGNYAGAQEEAASIKTIDPSSCEQYSLLADNFRRQGKLKEAIDEGLKDLSCPATDRDKSKKGNALFKVALSYEKLKDYQNAALYYKKIVDLEPIAWAYGNYGRALMLLNNLDEAEKMILKAISIMDYPKAHQYLAIIYFRKGDLFEKKGDDINAEKQFLLSLKEDSQDIFTCYRLADIYIRRGDCETAVKVAKFGARINPRDAYITEILSKCSQGNK